MEGFSGRSFMNCEWTKENVVLYLYDELPDDAKFEFMHHIQNCAECKRELESAQAFKEDVSVLPQLEVSPNLLAASRMQLQEALEHAEQNRSFWGMFVFDFAAWMHQIKLAPALTAALLIIGFAGGTITTWKLGTHEIVGPADPGPKPADLGVASIES